MNLQPLIENKTLAGAVTLIAGRDEIVRLESFGYADLAAQKPMTPETLFWIASVTKPITATALMILVDEGKVGLDDPVERYLPEFKDRWVLAEETADRRVLKKAAQPPLVRHLLSNTSGLPFRSPLETPTLDLHPLSLGVGGYGLLPLQSEPGTRYCYSNAGFNSAGRIIELVSGLSYEAFLQERLFTPLGMEDTTFWPNREQLSRLAKTYRANPEQKSLEEMEIDQLRYPLDDPRRRPMPAGGLFSTASDVAAFAQMILQQGARNGRRYLSAAAIATMTVKQTAPEITDAYGLGWGIDATGFGHGGAYKNNLHIDPRAGRIAILMVQQSGDWGSEEGKTIFSTLCAEAVA